VGSTGALGLNLSINAKCNWESKFHAWAQPLSATEEKLAENAVRIVSDALRVTSLDQFKLKIFAQGSYPANTNIRRDSDIDINACSTGIFFADYPAGYTREYFGNSGASVGFGSFKDAIGAALVARFGAAGVTRGDKAFDIHENTYRLDADVVPTFEYRIYSPNGSYIEGVRFITDSGKTITNFPQQSLVNGIAKNNATSRRYKQLVRIMKNLRNEMQEKKIESANNFASFLIESILWNISDSCYSSSSLYECVERVTSQAWYNLYAEDRCRDWMEVNNVKRLFGWDQPWTRQQAEAFLWDARQYIGFSK